MKVSNKPKVTVVIPVYNCEEYLQRCLDSVYAQTLTDYEIIAINDGSVDDSLAILKRNAKNRENFTVISQENNGQGFARNHAVDMAKGTYVQFVDSDDFIEPLTLELAVTRAENDKADIVHYDWKWSSLLPHRPAAYLYLNQEPFSYKNVLIGPECDELLLLWHFFTVNNLYRTAFLRENGVQYGEGRIYEDIIFMVLAANRANKISILHSPLYIVQRNMASASRSGYHDDRHYKGYILAVKNALAILEPRTKYTNFYLMKYLQTKFIRYYEQRVPRRFHKRFLKDYVDAVAGTDIVIPDRDYPERIMRLCLKYDVFNKKNYKLFNTIVFYKTQLLPQRDKLIHTAKKSKHALRNFRDTYQYQLQKPIIKKSIVFLGFDYRYSGNSRYLFEEIIKDKRFKNRDIKFITENTAVDEQYRLEPRTDEYKKWTARAELIIAESWVPGNIKKRDDAILLQLWHGTPLKKVLFDSNESEILQKNPKYKIGKHKNLMRWDYLIADSRPGVEKFKSAFLFPEKRIIQTGYPRVKFIISNKANKKLKQSIKEKIGLDLKLQKKKIVLYAPTWRDYNYGKQAEDQDFNYIINLNNLATQLGDEYLVLYHDHHFLSKMPGGLNKNCINASDYESQELLLIADYLVTDYSSIMFDAFAIDLPVIVFANDFMRYQKSRGVYKDVWEDIKPLAVDNEKQVAKQIKQFKIDDTYKTVSAKYRYNEKASLTDFVESLSTDTIERDW